jgi:hypothetical protein
VERLVGESKAKKKAKIRAAKSGKHFAAISSLKSEIWTRFDAMSFK